MARVRFISDYDYMPTLTSTVAYKAGMELTVKRDCADGAVLAGVAVEVGANRRAPRDGEAQEADDASGR